LATNSNAKEAGSRRSIGVVVSYGLMILFTIVAFLLIRSYGETLVPPPIAQAGAIAATAEGGDVFLRVLVALAAIIALIFIALLLAAISAEVMALATTILTSPVLRLLKAQTST
jgi:hypothetical protein